jgi:hypothetical protein
MADTPPDMRLELVPLPVSDVDKEKAFYEQVGFGNLHDTQVTEAMRVVQLTPPGSSCTIVFGTGMGPVTGMAPGSVRGLHLVVEDMAASRAALTVFCLIGGGPHHDWGSLGSHQERRCGARRLAASRSGPEPGMVEQNVPRRTGEFWAIVPGLVRVGKGLAIADSALARGRLGPVSKDCGSRHHECL